MRTALVAAAGIGLLAVAGWAAASSFSLSPLGLSIRGNEASAAVTARNQGDAAIVIQVRAYAWTQDGDGAEKRADTADLVVNPSVFRLGPGEEQLVRIGARAVLTRDAERAYRVVFGEVVPKQPAGAQSALRMSLAMDIPFYIEPAGAGSSGPLSWTAQKTPAGIRISGVNPGGRHVRLTDVVVRGAGGRELQRLAHLVVLANSKWSAEIEVPGGGSIAAVMLTGNDDNGIGAVHPVSFEIPVAARP